MLLLQLLVQTLGLIDLWTRVTFSLEDVFWWVAIGGRIQALNCTYMRFCVSFAVYCKVLIFKLSSFQVKLMIEELIDFIFLAC